MRKINDILNKSLKVIITIMIVFSSILVVNTNNVIAEENEIAEDVLTQEEQIEENVNEEEIIEPTIDELNKPLMANSSSQDPVPTKTYHKITFKNGLRTIGTIELEEGSKIDASIIPPDKYADWRSASKTPVWYYREYKNILSYSEHQWDFTNKVVDKDYTLYVKYKEIGFNGDFDFRVKHENSKTLADKDYAYNTGTYTDKDDDGYIYSYYSYETDVPFSYTEGQDNEYYTGTSFDLAIQESNPGDTIEILKDNLIIEQPVNIWGDVNLNLNGKKIIVDTSFIGKIINFINDLWEMLGGKQPLIRFKENFSPAIFVYNARTTISNGTIDNKKGEFGHGVVVYSENPDYVTYLENLNISTTSGADAVSAGYEGTRTNENNLPTEAFATGYVVITSGYYEGKIVNYNSDGSLIVDGGSFTLNPVANNAALGTDRYLYIDRSPVETYKYKIDEYELEAVIVDDGKEISQETLISALNRAESGQIIKLVKDVNLSEDLTIDNNGRSLTLDVNGYNITTSNNSTITFIDSLSEGKGEIKFENSDDYFNGQVDVAIEINDAIATVINGYYNSINGINKANVIVKGGYFVNPVTTNCLQDGYVCNPLYQEFLNKYNYQVVSSNELNVVKNETSGIEYSSLTKAIDKANIGDSIKILKDIRLADTVTIEKSLNISLDSNVNIRSTTLKSFVISGQGTIVTFEGVNKANNAITNDVIANGNESIVFEIRSNAKLIAKNITINADAQGCGDSELIAINTIETGASIKLDNTNVNTNKKPENKHIRILKNEASYANIELNDSMFIVLPCVMCLDMISILNSGDNSTINIKSSTIMLDRIGNQTDYIDCYGIHDKSHSSILSLDQTNIWIANNQGNTCSIYIENNSTLNVNNSSDISTDVNYDRFNSQIGIRTKGIVNIADSSVSAISSNGNASAIKVEDGVTTLNKATVNANAKNNEYCIDVEKGENGCSTVSVVGEGCYRNNNVNGKIVNNNNGTVEISGGHFSSDISNWLARNYKCTNNPYTVDKYIYKWSVDLSNCGLSVTVANDGTLVINYKITFDTFMLENPNKYGVRFISTMDEYDGVQLSIADTINNISLANGQKSKFEQNNNKGIYSFNIVARLMDSVIGVEIIDIETKHVYHRKNQYSVDAYYYDILKTLNNDKTYKYKDSMRDLAAAALNYGAYCQKMANPNIADDKLVNYLLDTYKDAQGQQYSKEFTGNYDADMENNEPENYSTGDLIDDFTNLEHSLLLKESTTLRFRFNMVNDGATIGDYEAYYKNVNESEDKYQKITPSSDSNSCFLDIPGIKPYDFNEKYILKIVKGDKSCFITYSPLDYIYKEYNNYLIDKKDNFLELARALYTYYKIASIYYGGL